ncbi:hypothetical protein [Aidingimonas halophila]|uniref:hypothetical protein n=1 Tax=Aidingimonas halophila TaxID=574349 RepID=UPI001114BEAE|nr:hypothetical protein [Aidingimonas halophila]
MKKKDFFGLGTRHATTMDKKNNFRTIAEHPVQPNKNNAVTLRPCHATTNNKNGIGNDATWAKTTTRFNVAVRSQQ